MPQDTGRRERGVAIASSDVGVTDANRLDTHQHLARARVVDQHIRDLKVGPRLPNDGGCRLLAHVDSFRTPVAGS
jgi:hypothetical protein